jgi:hypothetical protein
MRRWPWWVTISAAYWGLCLASWLAYIAFAAFEGGGDFLRDFVGINLGLAYVAVILGLVCALPFYLVVLLWGALGYHMKDRR